MLQSLSEDHVNENIENAEVPNLHEPANETNETDATVEENKQLACAKQDQVSEAVPTDRICEENKISPEEEKHVNESYKQSGNNHETITYSEEKQIHTESLDENIDEEEKERIVHPNEIKGKESPEEKVKTLHKHRYS